MKKSFKKHLHHYEKTHAALRDHVSKKTTRRFRLSIKSIRALLRAADLYESAKELTYIQHMRKGYKKVGKVRQRQIYHKCLAPYASLSTPEDTAAFLTWADEKKQRALQKMHRRCQKSIPKSKKLRKLWKKNDHPDNLNAIIAATKQQADTIITQKQLTEDDLHTIRKAYKHILVLASYLDDATQQAPLEQTYTPLQKMLGRRNDRIELRDMLQTYLTKYENQSYTHIFQEVQQFCDDQYDEILATLRAEAA